MQTRNGTKENKFKQRKFDVWFSLKFGKEGGQENTDVLYKFSIHHRHWQFLIHISCAKLVL